LRHRWVEWPSRRMVAAAAALVLAFATGGGAQEPVAPPDSVIGRMQRLIAQGDSGSTVRLADSVLASSGVPELRLAEALYWKATIRATPETSRQALLRLVVEAPLSPRVGDALIRLADEEFRIGDRTAARRHLERLVQDHLDTDRAVKSAQQLAQMLIDNGEMVPACAVLDSAKAHVSTENVELGNQIAYTRRRCPDPRDLRNAPSPAPADSMTGARPDSGGRRAPPRGEATSAPKTSAGQARATKAAVQWSVQVAAYASRGDALRLAARLSARAYDVRVTGDKPYRVRIGRFASRDAATAIIARLKMEKTDAIIVEAERR